MTTGTRVTRGVVASRDGASGPCGEGPGRASPAHQGGPHGLPEPTALGQDPRPKPARGFIDTLKEASRRA